MDGNTNVYVAVSGVSVGNYGNDRIERFSSDGAFLLQWGAPLIGFTHPGAFYGYSVSGTVGQPDAVPAMTNGQYAVTGGFWALPTAVQTPGSPTLSIAPAAPGSATISWTPNTPGFVLQESLHLSPANWTNSPSGGTNPVAVPVTLPTKFYRLSKP